MYCIISDGTRSSELLGGRGGGGSHPDPEIRGARSSTNIFFGPSGLSLVREVGGALPRIHHLLFHRIFLPLVICTFQGALLLTEVLKERDAQIEMKNGKLDAEKIREEHLLRLQQRVRFPISQHDSE